MMLQRMTRTTNIHAKTCAPWPAFAVLSLTLFCLSSDAIAAQVHSYPRIEASFAITNLATDPFDFVQTDVRVQITQPDATLLSLPAFFDGGTTWRVRHTPSLPGLYQVANVTLNGMTLAVNNLQPSSWTVSGPPSSAGFVRVDPANARRFITDTERRYFPVGHNVAWWTNNIATNIAGVFAKMGAARENWSRVWMDHFYESKNLEWPKVGSLGQLSLTVARRWDTIVAAAEQNGVHFQMTLQHHGQYSTTVNPNWNENPYNTAQGGFLSNPTQFFTNATAKALTKRKLRYIVARWGYSPAIMAWELFNEVQFTDAAQSGQWAAVGAWHDEMAQFLRSQDVYQHLITTSSELDQPIWAEADYYQSHLYPSDVVSNLRDAPGTPAGQPVKPIFPGESHIDDTPHLGVNAPLWASVMAAQSGNGQPWWWDRIDADNDYSHFRAVSDFVSAAGIADQDTLVRTAPHVTCPVSGTLAFSPGGDWQSATQDTFTVGHVAPDGIGSLPRYLQGTFHREMTPNGYTFLVNYPQAGTFSVQILQIAAFGAGLRITVDTTTTNSISFPGTGSDRNTNVTLSVNVSAGQHTVKLWNPGSDWLVLGNITLNPYVPMLGAYGIANTNFAALWLWHRTNLFYTNATATLSGTVSVSGLQLGTYSATWWDTFAGVPLSNFTFTVSNTNEVPLPTPPILRSVALYAGAPPQASISAPPLTHTLGTNSPALNLPLTITNRGGLPLAYSICVTGASPVAYAAANSTQPDGPGFAWKDISAVGRDITTNFTALAAPKNAKDEGIAGPIEIGFGFPFFSGAQSPGIFTQLYVSPNGFVAFNPFSGDTSTNKNLPNNTAATNLIAFFWDDLDLSAGGRIYAFSDPVAGAFTLQFQGVRFKSSGATVTCQLILKTTGEIVMQYKSIGISNLCTVGLQNAAANQGLQVAHNQNYLQNNFSICLSPTRWLGLAAHAGLVPKSKADTVTVSLNATGLAYGTYRATLLVKTSDASQPLVSLPVTLDISPIGTWRQTHFGTAANFGSAADTTDVDLDGMMNVFEYAFGLDPNSPSPSPFTFAAMNGHLTVTFRRPLPAPTDISYLVEVTDDLSSGVWNSGPGQTSQTAIDNGDGTETVTVTDLAAPPSPATHFLRFQIGRP